MKNKHIQKRSINVVIVVVIISFIWSIQPVSAYEKEIKAIATGMAEKIIKTGKKSVAVVDFTDLQGNVTELGRFIAEEFSASLLSAGEGFELIDRTHLQSLLKEHKLSTTGLIDPQTARKLGQIAGVEALITGTITPFGESVRLSAKILDAETAKVIGANTGDIPKTEAIKELLGKSITTDTGTESDRKTTFKTTTNSKTITVKSIFSEMSANIYCHQLPRGECIGFHIIRNIPVLEKLFGVGPVVCSHPVDGNTPAVFYIDVEGGKPLEFKVFRHPSGDGSLVEIWAGDKMLFGENITQPNWQSVSVPIPQNVQKVELRHIITGGYFEQLYFSFGTEYLTN